MIRLKSTSLDMKTMDSKSNGALAWSNSFDLGCNSTFNYTFHSSSGESALVPVQAESLRFERPGYSRSSSGGHLKAALTGGLSLIDGQQSPTLLSLSTSEVHPGRSQAVAGKEQMGRRWQEGHWLLTCPEFLPPCLCSGCLPLLLLFRLQSNAFLQDTTPCFCLSAKGQTSPSHLFIQH